MISLQKAMRLGIASELSDNTDAIKNVYIRVDCSPETIADVRRLYGDIKFSAPLSYEDFDKIIQKIYKNKSLVDNEEILSLGKTISIDEAKQSLLKQTSIESKEDDAPAIQLLNSILAQALAKNASDIHFEPNEKITLL